MDDTATVTEAGLKTEVMNSYIVTHTANKSLQFNVTKSKTMQVGKSLETIIDQVIEVDSWSADHNTKGILVEEYEGKVAMKDVNAYKYLGYVVSASASNVPNILDEKGKVSGMYKKIMKITKGLGTFEFTLIYMKSVIRGNTLNASGVELANF